MSTEQRWSTNPNSGTKFRVNEHSGSMMHGHERADPNSGMAVFGVVHGVSDVRVPAFGEVSAGSAERLIGWSSADDGRTKGQAMVTSSAAKGFCLKYCR